MWFPLTPQAGALLLLGGGESLLLTWPTLTPPWQGLGAPRYSLVKVEVFASSLLA